MIGKSVKEAAKEWGVSASTVRNWCKQALIVAQRKGRDWLIFSSDPPSLPTGRPPKESKNTAPSA